MASSNNLATIDPWMFRSPINDSFYPADAFARETESALTKALQQSLYNHQQQQQQSYLVNQSDYNHCGNYSRNFSSVTPSASTITGSGSGSVSGSEPETPGSKRRGSNLGVSIGKSAKRKSRASKRSMTTFIQADPANFRQMVQQVTGVKLHGNGHLPVSTVVKPEPLRQPFVNKLQGLLPTLDTSAYLLHNQTVSVPVSGSGFSQLSSMNHTAADGGAAGDFYSFSTFPTLESSI